MSVKLPKPPRIDTLFSQDAQGRLVLNQGVMRDLRIYLENIGKVFERNSGAIPWGSIEFSGSKLMDIETRRHADLQLVEQVNVSDNNTDRTKHLSNAMAKAWEEHRVATSAHGITAPSVIVGTEEAQTLQNKTLDSSNKYGGDTNNTTFEADGTMVMNGDATVWKDIKFPMAPPKTVGAGNPTLTIYNGNMRGYSFAVGDAHDFDPQEMDHDAKIGSTATWHVHWLSQSNDGTERAVKWQLEYAVEPANGALPAPTTVSVEVAIPAGTAANTVQRDNVTTFVIPAIARLAYARISRIAAAGVDPSVDPILSAMHFHYEVDTIGSRQITTK